MNYFEFYGIPMSFEVDSADLKKRFYANSKKYHPDFYTLESAEKQAEILALSSLNNKAYQVLADFDKRMAYILRLKGCLEEEGQNKIPQDFLMEMMEINEAMMELEFGFDASIYEKTQQSIHAIEENLRKKAEPTLIQFSDNQSINLKAIKDYYLKKRYLLRIQENLNKFAPH